MIVKRAVGQEVVVFLPNFSIKDFFCKCGKCDPQNIHMRAVSKLQTLRDLLGGAIVVNSAYRCPAHNYITGGSPGSPHMSGLAFDITSPKATPFELLVLGHKVGFTGFGLAKTFAHLDDRKLIDPSRFRFWTYGDLNVLDERKRFDDAISK